MENIRISSPSFENNDWIPNQFSGYGEDISPEIIIEMISDKAVSMAVTLDDLDHPIFPGYNHWVAWNLEPMNSIPQALPKGKTIESPIYAQQGLAYGKHCYRGPKPPFNWNHRYRFTVYILDTKLVLNPDSTKKDFLKEISGHVLQQGELQGKYQKRHK